MSCGFKVAIDPGVSDDRIFIDALTQAIGDLRVGMRVLRVEVKGTLGPWVHVTIADDLPDDMLAKLGELYKKRLIKAGAIT